MVISSTGSATARTRTPKSRTPLPCHGAEALRSHASATAHSAEHEATLETQTVLQGAHEQDEAATRPTRETRSQASRRRKKERQRKAQAGGNAEAAFPRFQPLPTLVQLREPSGRPPELHGQPRIFGGFGLAPFFSWYKVWEEYLEEFEAWEDRQAWHPDNEADSDGSERRREDCEAHPRKWEAQGTTETGRPASIRWDREEIMRRCIPPAE